VLGNDRDALMLSRSEYERAKRLIADGSGEWFLHRLLLDPNTSDEFDVAYRGRASHPYIYVGARRSGGVQVHEGGAYLRFESRPLPVRSVLAYGVRLTQESKVAFVIDVAREQRTHIELVRTSRPRLVFVIHPSTRAPGMWQMTHFDAHGPSGDTQNARLEPLVHEALYNWQARVFRPGTLDPRVRRFDPGLLERMTPRANPRPRAAARAPRLNPERLISNDDYVPDNYSTEIHAAAPRAIAAGARAPLEYLGIGQYGIVFRDARRTWKVARNAHAARSIHEEYEWFRTANTVPWVRDHVVRVAAWHPCEGVMERESIEPRTSRLGWRRPEHRETNVIHMAIQDRMIPYGWSAPEYKPESYIHVRGRGAVLFDGSSAHMLGSRMARHVADVLDGRVAADPYENRETLAFYIRRELSEGALPPHIGKRLLDRIAAAGSRANPRVARSRR